MKTISEEPIDPEIMKSIRGFAKDALAVLGKGYSRAKPPKVVEGIDDFAYRWQKKDRPPKKVVKDMEEARLIFGSLWGEQLVKAFGWEWAKVTFHDHDDSWAYGVFSTDRSLAIYPLHFMLGCLQDPNVDATILLSFNLLLDKTRIPKFKKKSYTNVMEGVTRIVPRA